jgi:hypothetical protein
MMPAAGGRFKRPRRAGRGQVSLTQRGEAAANAVLHGASPAAAALSAGAALAVLAGYVAVLAGAGAALTARREIGTTTG